MVKTLWTRALMALMALAVLAAPAMAQEKKAEINVLFGWSFMDGIDGENAVVVDGQVYDRIDPKDAFKWGLSGGALVGPNWEVGFMFSQAPTTLQAGGTNTEDIGDMTVNNYHGYFGYNGGPVDAPARVYFFLGLGATDFGSVDYTRPNGMKGETSGATKFSTTWGLGVKIAPDRPVGARIGIHWTPTYIKSEADGWWCDPYWGCYATGSSKYANQWDLMGALSFKF